jgi:hypothetical protein
MGRGMSTDKLTKVRVELPNHWAVSGESMWARAVGGDHFELHNSPFYAYDLNYLDVVVAVADDPNHKPLIQRVARRSGHRTLRVIFKPSVRSAQRELLLKGLDRHGVTWEGATRNLFALDIPPEGGYQATCNQLWAWEQEGLLEYETCEARVLEGFDDAPEED